MFDRQNIMDENDLRRAGRAAGTKKVSSSVSRGRMGHWWLPWTSNPVAGSDPGCGGFDSHAPSPFYQEFAGP